MLLRCENLEPPMSAVLAFANCGRAVVCALGSCVPGSDIYAVQQIAIYSMTSSARASIGGISRPRRFGSFAANYRSTLVGCTTIKWAGSCNSRQRARGHDHARVCGATSYGRSSALVRSPIFSRRTDSGSRPNRALISFWIEEVS